MPDVLRQKGTGEGRELVIAVDVDVDITRLDTAIDVLSYICYKL